MVDGLGQSSGALASQRQMPWASLSHFAPASLAIPRITPQACETPQSKLLQTVTTPTSVIRTRQRSSCRSDTAAAPRSYLFSCGPRKLHFFGCAAFHLCFSAVLGRALPGAQPFCVLCAGNACRSSK